MDEKKLAQYDDISQEMRQLYLYKNKHYGDSTTETFKEFGMASYAIRLNDKMRRLKSLTKLHGTAELDSPAWVDVNDAIIDTLFDMANYAILALIDLNDDITVSEMKSGAAAGCIHGVCRPGFGS